MGLDLVQRVGLHRLGDRLAEGLVEVRQRPQQQPLGALETVLLHVLVEGHVALEHVAGDRFGAHAVLDPWVLLLEGVEGLVQEVFERLRPRDLLELGHA